jgi:hypothetical protein
MVGQRQSRAFGISCLVVLLAGCGKTAPRNDENAPRPLPQPDGIAQGAASAEARIDAIMSRSRMARDEGTMAVGGPEEPRPPRLVAALSPGLVERLDPAADGLDPAIADGRSLRRARVTLPRSSAGAFRLVDTRTGRGIAIHLEGARDRGAELARGLVIWRGGAPYGGDLIARPDGNGVEDYVAFDTRPSAERLVYHVDVSAFAGLRLVDRVLEFLDEAGVPRLRMTRPYLADASAKRIEARVEVGGCAVDTDPRPPYGRAVTPPGASSCAVTIAWSGASYPILVDPTWNDTTHVMTSLRKWHTASLLVEGKVLIAGGNNLTTTLASAEVYDPANGTFATLAPMSTPRTGHAMGWRMVTGGMNASSQPLSSAEWLKNDASGWITSAQSMKAARVYHAMAGFSSNGKFVVAGGTTADLFDIASGGTFTALPALSEDKRYHAGLQISPTEVWMVGGYRWNGANVYQTSVDIYRSDNTRTTGPAMPHEHAQGGAVVLTGGAVVVHTGLGSGATFADVYKSGTWTSTSRSWRRDHQVVALADGTALIVGHGLGTERYDPIAKAFSSAGNSKVARENATATLLGDGRVLVVGGHQPGVATPIYNTGELFQLAPNGAMCTSAGECATLHCVEGVCCNTACSTTCMSCLKSKQGTGADGTCGVVAKDTDPNNDCGPSAKETCGTTGLCNGTGACAFWPTTTVCKNTCVGSSQTTTKCDGAGHCNDVGAPVPCTSPPQCAATGDICLVSCATTSQCGAGTYCLNGQCTQRKSIGTTCSLGEECNSDLCVEGVCCNESCGEGCRSCLAARKGDGTADGACGNVAAGTDPKDLCTEDTTSPCARTGLCDGKGACAFASTTTECSPPECTGESEQTTSFCDGAGMCVATASSCNGARCDDEVGACIDPCEASSDCVSGNYCEDGKCITAKGSGEPCALDEQCVSGLCANGKCAGSAVCDGDHTVLTPSGTSQDCSPYRCTGDGKCRETCSSTADCTQGNACSAEGKCETDTGPTTGEPGGCACRASVGDDAEGGLAFGAIAVVMASIGRRRRARKGSRRGEAACRFRA